MRAISLARAPQAMESGAAIADKPAGESGSEESDSGVGAPEPEPEPERGEDALRGLLIMCQARAISLATVNSRTAASPLHWFVCRVPLTRDRGRAQATLRECLMGLLELSFPAEEGHADSWRDGGKQEQFFAAAQRYEDAIAWGKRLGHEFERCVHPPPSVTLTQALWSRSQNSFRSVAIRPQCDMLVDVPWSLG